MMRLVRRGKLRYLLLTAVTATVLLLLYHGLSPGVNSLAVGDARRQDGNNKSGHYSWLPWVLSGSTFAVGNGGGATGGSSSLCPGSSVRPSDGIDINTVDVYPKLNFKPNFRFYWNHTFEKRYLKFRETWKNLPLKVIVLPHSHNDPGWLKTFDNYFLTSTAFILNHMADRLDKYRNMTFIWSEISYFSKWWESTKNRPHLRDAVRRQLARGQLEMATGGWVMTDEATAHYYAMVDQLVEGHQWLKTTLNVSPTAGWSIDPFGHSATVPYILRAAGIHNTVIQRTHFAWKQYLAERRQLQFRWRQLFDLDLAANGNSSGADILCHMAPFDLYSIKHTCGPDQDVCLQFDFRRVAGEYSESTAVQINDDNIEQKAKLLLGQYGRLGSLYSHNVALVFLGDDFRYNHDVEWDQQYHNYKRLFDYINNRKDLNAEVKFGTLSDYFREVHQRTEKSGDIFPTLTGDFVPYGDIYAESRPSYWTGYFTTRPYWKHLSRELEHWLRSAEILYTLCRTVARQRGNTRLQDRLNQDYLYLSTARQELALFQHHDAITGTSKAEVMHDYGMRLYRGIREAIGVISHGVQYVMLKEPIVSPADLRPAHPLTSYLFPDINRSTYDSPPHKIPLQIPPLEGRKLVIFNSALQQRQQVLRVLVKNPDVKVLDQNNQEVAAQVNPAWNGSVEILSDVFELVFVANLPPLSLVTYSLQPIKKDVANGEGNDLRPTVSVLLNDAYAEKPTQSLFHFHNAVDEDILLETPYISALFSKSTGLLKKMVTKGADSDSSTKAQVNMFFQAYKSEDFRSGAYLFQPNRVTPVLNVTDRFPVVRVVRGPVVSEVTTIYPALVSVTCRVYHLDGPLGTGVEVLTSFDLAQRKDANMELFMRLDSDLQNDGVFYTDANGFSTVRRQYQGSLPVEANYYPATTSVFLQDFRSRLSLLLSHAHGTTSAVSGRIEVMLDRRLRYDDGRGLGEGILDNKKTADPFWIVLERFNPEAEEEVPSLSLLTHVLSEILNYPPILLVADTGEDRPLESSMSFLEGHLPCNLHLVTLRTLPDQEDFKNPSDASLLILHKKGVPCHVNSPPAAMGSCQTEAVTRNFTLSNVRINHVKRTSLTGLVDGNKLQSLGEVLSLSPMHMQAYKVLFAR